MKKYVSSSKQSADVFADDIPKEACKKKYLNFCTLMKSYERDPLEIAVVNCDSKKNDRIRIASTHDNIFLIKGNVPVREYPGWPHSCGLITDNPKVTLVNCNPNAIYFHNKDESIVGTAICSPMLVVAFNLIENIITAFSDYDCPVDDIYVEYPPHLPRLIVKEFIKRDFRHIKPMPIKKSQEYDIWLFWTNNQPKKDA